MKTSSIFGGLLSSTLALLSTALALGKEKRGEPAAAWPIENPGNDGVPDCIQSNGEQRKGFPLEFPEELAPKGSLPHGTRYNVTYTSADKKITTFYRDSAWDPTVAAVRIFVYNKSFKKNTLFNVVAYGGYGPQEPNQFYVVPAASRSEPLVKCVMRSTLTSTMTLTVVEDSV